MVLQWTYKGVNTSVEGTGGEDCVNFSTFWNRTAETIVLCLFFGYLARWAISKAKLNEKQSVARVPEAHSALLVALCLTFGVEIGFKLATETLIWILNPCHVLTVIQIFLLTAKPCRLVTAVFRLHVYLLNGPFLAFAFPILNTRQLPFEQLTYFVQHILLMAIPFFIVDQNSVYSVEKLDDLSWLALSFSFQIIYHFLVLQPIALITHVNVNNIICPAISDPFAGPNYRVMAVLHQLILALLLGKSFACMVLKPQKRA